MKGVSNINYKTLRLVAQENPDQLKNFIKEYRSRVEKLRVYPINCVNFLEPLKSTIKFDYKMSHSFIPVRDRHGPFFGNIINR